MTRLTDLLSRHGRPSALFVALWLFGISTTLLLVALWGRSVAVDEATLAESAEAVLESGYVHERVDAWVADGLAVTVDASPEELAPVVDAIVASDQLDAALGTVVDDLVDAALSPDAETVRIDIAAVLADMAPVAEAALADAGHEVDATAVAGALDDSPELVLSDDDLGALASATLGTRNLLTRAVVASGALVLLAAAAAIWLADDRIAQVRDLGTRLVLSAVGFAVFLRVGAWATDPTAGRSPVAAGGSVLLGSNGHVPLSVGAVALLVALGAAIAVVRRRRRRRDDTPTAELPVLERV